MENTSAAGGGGGGGEGGREKWESNETDRECKESR